jgi:hypothetical protein
MLGIVATQRHVVAFDEKLNGVTQRGKAFDQHGLAADQAHLHETTPGAPAPTDPEDLAALSRPQVAQRLAGKPDAMLPMTTPTPSLVALSKRHTNPFPAYCK